MDRKKLAVASLILVLWVWISLHGCGDEGDTNCFTYDGRTSCCTTTYDRDGDANTYCD